ncbi:TetR/AcrR family transcriptional regulator [Skermania sp. ID1734]|uniref:TetR/AcrR family transcriptional regulator n=1 Tax=Skermania sp. ID1734 TaxID=2597516 RepID=UPI0021026B8A|nr:TetR/AcrR family transcriptional regulator [Skermania sp. ID1734]
MQTGRRLFGERGYHAVSAEEIGAAAGVTRGALHHHFGDKRGLFQQVLEELEIENTAEVRAAVAAAPDVLSGLTAGLGSFLDICQRPEVVQIALTDAPAVLGWPAWREMEARHGLGLITEALTQAREQGLVAEAAIPVLAQLFLSAITEAGLIIANADDPAAKRGEVEQSLLLMINGVLITGQ